MTFCLRTEVAACNSHGMEKDTHIMVRVSSELKAAAFAVAEARGETLSDIIRASLSRMVARNKKDGDK